MWTETHRQNPSKGLRIQLVSRCGFLRLQLVDEIDCTLVSLSRPKQWSANARTSSAFPLQAQKHLKKTHRLSALPLLHHPFKRVSLQTSPARKQAIFVLSDYKYCFGKVV